MVAKKVLKKVATRASVRRRTYSAPDSIDVLRESWRKKTKEVLEEAIIDSGKR